jgi:NADPH:quinone reductase-like Zn-dependent oxidoreductase
MRAVICTKYGPPEVLPLKDLPKPTPKSTEVCIKIFATAVTASDLFINIRELAALNAIAVAQALGGRSR